MLSIVASAVTSAVILVVFRDALFLYLAVTMVWIFACLLFSNWFPLPATLGAMVSALGIFAFLQGTVGGALWFYVAYALNWFIGGASVVVVDALVWPFTTRKVFVRRLAEVYAGLEEDCRQAARWLRSATPQPAPETEQDWAPFRQLRQQVAPELRRARKTTNPFSHMILACRSLNLRLWFFNRAIAPAAPSLPAETRRHLASLLDACGDHLRALLESALYGKPVVVSDEWRVTSDEQAGHSSLATRHSSLRLLAHGIYLTILHRVVRGLRAVTVCHEALFANFQKGLAGELVALRPVTTGTRLLDVQSLRSSTKLVVILLLLLLEEAWLSFPRRVAGRVLCDVLREHR